MNYLGLWSGRRYLFTEANPEEPPGNASSKSPAPRAGSPAPRQEVPPCAAWKPEVDRKEGNPGPSRHNNTVLSRPPRTHTHLNAPQPGDMLVVSHWLMGHTMVILGEEIE